MASQYTIRPNKYKVNTLSKTNIFKKMASQYTIRPNK